MKAHVHVRLLGSAIASAIVLFAHGAPASDVNVLAFDGFGAGLGKWSAGQGWSIVQDPAIAANGMLQFDFAAAPTGGATYESSIELSAPMGLTGLDEFMIATRDMGAVSASVPVHSYDIEYRVQGSATWQPLMGMDSGNFSMSAGSVGLPPPGAVVSIRIRCSGPTNSGLTGHFRFDEFVVYGLSAGAALPSVTTASLPAATVGTPYSQILAATGGDPAYGWTLTAGSLPAGLHFGSFGIVDGTPTATSAANLTVEVEDGTSALGSGVVALTVAGAGGGTTVGTPASKPSSGGGCTVYSGPAGFFWWVLAGVATVAAMRRRYTTATTSLGALRLPARS